ncbi:hypothetical protein NDU88_004344 [Pleurodeles waltl]|uniref:Uncharacterized protein n=1 Tax=Pleurodeles waltl TaxID=8319 RepID=A0AAV7UHW8_PLEWA|nr:hypothetical protein NDU88_004344 [Pleurodeles waltl]
MTRYSESQSIVALGRAAPRRSHGESDDRPRNQSEAAERRERRPGPRDGPSPGGPLSLALGDQGAWRAQSGPRERLDRSEGLGPETPSALEVRGAPVWGSGSGARGWCSPLWRI